MPNDIRSDEFNEIIGRMPTWFVRFGTYLILSLVIFASIILYLFPYEETVRLPTKISIVNPPQKYISSSGGYLTKLVVKNDEYVDSGQLLFVINTKITYKNIVTIDSICKHYIKQSTNTALTTTDINMEVFKTIGESSLQSEYIDLLYAFDDFKNSQKSLKNEKNLIFSRALKKFFHSFSIWKLNHFCISKTTGRIIINKNAVAGGKVVDQQVICVQVPTKMKYNAIATGEIKDLIHIKNGQKGLIVVDNYPVKDYGAINVTVSDVENYFTDSTFTAQLLLIDGITTNKSIILPSIRTLNGYVDITINETNYLSHLITKQVNLF